MSVSYDVADTLRAQTHGHEPVVLIYDARGNGEGMISPTITGDHQDRITDYTAVVVECYAQPGYGRWRQQEVSDPIRASGGDIGGSEILIVEQNRTEQNEAVSIGNGQLHNINMTPITNPLDCMHDAQAIMLKDGDEKLNAVRRLTPTECERLQGMPDDWTDIGDWIDEQGKKHKAADSPRYKALGNGIALPFWEWLLGRISEQYDRPATLGSLFDGISSFPLAWSKFNGKENCLWCSEIEPFPIAVSRTHFPDEDEDV